MRGPHAHHGDGQYTKSAVSHSEREREEQEKEREMSHLLAHCWSKQQQPEGGEKMANNKSNVPLATAGGEQKDDSIVINARRSFCRTFITAPAAKPINRDQDLARRFALLADECEINSAKN